MTTLLKIELVGGPLCGTVVKWESDMEGKAFVYYGGEAHYKLDSARTAFYQGG